MKTNFILITLCIFASVTQASHKNDSFQIDHNLEIYKKYINLEKDLKSFLDRNVRRILPYILEASEEVNISSRCMDNLFQLLSGFRKLSVESIKFLDATGKPLAGMMPGNLMYFGEDQECFDTVVKNKNKISFRGQQCLLAIRPVLPDPDYKNEELKKLTQNSAGLMKVLLENIKELHMVAPKIGICVPSGCSKNDISEIFNYISEKFFINATVLNCVKNEDLSYWTNDRILSACVFAFFGVLLVLSTIFDNALEERRKEKLGLFSRIIECFSVTKTFPKLINTNTSKDTITCFYGIRVLSTFWIILCHEYVVHGTELVSNHIKNVDPFIKSFIAQIVLNGFTATEIFFFLGGFVNSYTRVKLQKSGKSQPSFFQIMFHRLWRIYPTLIIALFASFLLNYSTAAFYTTVDRNREVCRKEWWKNILFINNFFKPLSVCIPHTWYLCTDMQLFLLSLVTVPILLKNEKIGIYLHVCVIFIANIGTFMLWWIQHLPPSPTNFRLDNLLHIDVLDYFEFQASMYMLPFLHIASYYIGILFGYFSASKEKKIFSKKVWLVGWLTASFFYLCTIFLTYRWNSESLYTNIESSLYGSFSKSVLVLCVSWMVYCCSTDQARFVNYILSLKIWIPLSRITYMLYLLSIMMQYYHHMNLNFAPDFESLSMIWAYFGNLSISILMSLALVLLVESPFMALEKIIFRRRQEENKSTSNFQTDITLNGIKENGFKEHVLKENDKKTTIHL